MSVPYVTAITDSLSHQRLCWQSIPAVSRNVTQWRWSCPVYEYVCDKCHTAFEAILTIKEHDKEKIVCPKCGSRKVEQGAAEFYAVTSHKS